MISSIPYILSAQDTLCFNPLELLQQVGNMMPTTHIFLLILLPLALATRQCEDPSCFVKKLFDFSYPNEDIYNITLSGNQPEMINFIKAYGDFNSDLRSDYVSLDSSNNILIFIYSTTSNLYELSYTISPYQSCIAINFFLYDINGDGSLDITVWGSNGGGNCMYPLIQANSNFIVSIDNTLNFTTTTTQPSLFEFNLPAGGGIIKTNGLLIFNNDNSSRFIQYYQVNTGYTSLAWTQLFASSTDYTSIPFASYHWNTFIDITNDCFPQFVITNNQNQIQFWVYNSSNGKFFLSDLKDVTNMLSLNIIDVNYDGGLDLIIAQPTQINIYLGTNTLNIDSKFCVSQSYGFGFQWSSPIVYWMDANQVLITQNLQFADLNINGYPQMMVLANINGGPNTIIIYENKFETGGIFEVYGTYNNKATQFINNLPVFTVSFFDILDNGIVDILVNVNSTSGVIESIALYNNYLYQNFFYIKAYGTNGKTTNKGAQLPGVSFYWLNSVGNSQKVSINAQITQASYNAFPMPYVLTGLGRANNYVEMFTVGRLGEQESWSPIIPNSQLAIFSGNEPSSTWGIKIFIMPADSLVYVVIVCIIILSILGIILAAIKIQRKRNQEQIPLLNAI